MTAELTTRGLYLKLSKLLELFVFIRNGRAWGWHKDQTGISVYIGRIEVVIS